MCKGGLLHWHSARDSGAKKMMEHYNKYANKILDMIRNESGVIYKVNEEI